MNIQWKENLNDTIQKEFIAWALCTHAINSFWIVSFKFSFL
jgi:hypothetical protein